METIVGLNSGKSCKIAYSQTKSGFAKAETIIFLHGFGSSRKVINATLASSFQEEARQKGQKLNVFTLDLPGHGDSEKNLDSFSIDIATESVEKFMDCMALSQAHIYGSSMGGSVGIKLAAKCPHKVKSLTIQGAPIHGGSLRKFKMISRALFSIRHALRAIRRSAYTPQQIPNIESKIFRILQNQNTEAMERIFDMDNMREIVTESIGKIPIVAAMEYILDMINLDLTEELKNLQVPLFIVDGEKPEYPFVDTMDKIKTLVPESRVLKITSEGHLVTVLKHKTIAKHLLDFISNSS